MSCSSEFGRIQRFFILRQLCSQVLSVYLSGGRTGEDPGNEFDSAPAVQASLMTLLASCNHGNSIAFQLNHRKVLCDFYNYMFVQSFSVITDTVGTRENVPIKQAVFIRAASH